MESAQGSRRPSASRASTSGGPGGRGRHDRARCRPRATELTGATTGILTAIKEGSPSRRRALVAAPAGSIEVLSPDGARIWSRPEGGFTMIDTSGLPQQVRAGRLPAGIYSDPDLHAAEREHLFSRAWQFLAHESEIPKPGDFVVRRILDDSFIVTRDDSGAVRVLLNQCRHRGMQVCRAEAGQASFFRCPYHAWTYRNTGELVGVPFHLEAYGGDEGLLLSGAGLASPPRVESYNGLIFANLDRDAVGLQQSLGDMRFFLDLYTRQSPDGVEVSRTAALARGVQLEDRRRELRRGLLSHAAHPHERGRDRAVR